jgi:hypothetical protein
MATWNDVVSYLNANYKCKQESSELVSLLFNLGNDRSQVVWVELGGNDKIGQFAHISSAVGNVKNLNKLEAYCREAKDYVLGGIVIEGDHIMLRDSFPLLNLDVNEMEAPLHVILGAADQIEAKITGGDTY